MSSHKILGIIGSIRSNHKHISLLEKAVKSSSSQNELYSKIHTLDQVFSNTDIAVAFALLGAQLEQGANIEIVSITDIFKHSKMKIYKNLLNYETIDDIGEIDSLTIDEHKLMELIQKVKEARGIVLGTPVYFGDRSSIANKFFQVAQKYQLLRKKPFGVVSVGAKRNGGQETANIYSLHEALTQGAIVVGNGPKTSQYGGTVWAGDAGKAIDDDFGLETCYGVGRQVSILSDILYHGQSTTSEKLRITFLVTMDTKEKKYEKLLLDYIDSLDKKNIEYIVHNLTNDTIYRCIACTLCPSPKMMERLKDEEYPYHCVIQTSKDHMNFVQELLVNSDCIVFVGVNSHDDLTYRYQAFMERTRFIRHDDFELTNTPALGMLINDISANNNQIHNVKVLTSFIRHNTFFLQPINIYIHNNHIIHQDDFNKYIRILQEIKHGRQKIKPLQISYKATGYENKALDYTFKLRK